MNNSHFFLPHRKWKAILGNGIADINTYHSNEWKKIINLITVPCEKIFKLENIYMMNNSFKIYCIHTVQVFVDCRCCILFIWLLSFDMMKINQITKNCKMLIQREKHFSNTIDSIRKRIHFLCAPTYRKTMHDTW